MNDHAADLAISSVFIWQHETAVLHINTFLMSNIYSLHGLIRMTEFWSKIICSASFFSLTHLRLFKISDKKT